MDKYNITPINGGAQGRRIPAELNPTSTIPI